MNRSTVRKLQISCFLFAHIPLAAVAAFVFYADLRGETGVLVTAFLSTLAAAILLWTFIGRTLGQPATDG